MASLDFICLMRADEFVSDTHVDRNTTKITHTNIYIFPCLTNKSISVNQTFA